MNRGGQRGSAVVEFVGVGALVTLAALTVLQVGVVSHVRSIVTDSAIAGAAYAALADSTVAAGVARTSELLDAGLASDLIRGVSGSHSTLGGSPVVIIAVDYRVPGLGPWLPLVSSTVRGHAFIERL